MTEQEIRKIVREEIKKMIPELFSRSLRQLREFFISQIN